MANRSAENTSCSASGGEVTWAYTREETNVMVSLRKEPRDSRKTAWRSSNRPTVQKRKFELKFAETTSLQPHLLFEVSGTKSYMHSFRAAFVADYNRIRGVDCTATKQLHMLDSSKPREDGRHENVIYYDPVSHSIINEHNDLTPEEISFFDLESFSRFVCTRWNVDLNEERSLL